MKRILVLIGMAGLAAALPAQNVVRYPYDVTKPTRVKAPSAESGIELRLATPELFASYLCGAYEASGNELHLFPDGTAMLSTSCDVCPTTLVAEGRWTADPSGIQIAWRRRHDAPAERERFTRTFGAMEKLTLLLGFKGGSFGLEAGVRLVSQDVAERFFDAFQATINAPPSTFGSPTTLGQANPARNLYAHAAFVRVEKYVDWQAVRKTLESSATNRE